MRVRNSSCTSHPAEAGPSGSLDTGFNPNASSSVYFLALQADGKILMGGLFTTVGVGVARNRIARLNAEGSLDTGFNPDANYAVYSVALQADGKMVITFAQPAGVSGITYGADWSQTLREWEDVPDTGISPATYIQRAYRHQSGTLYATEGIKSVSPLFPPSAPVAGSINGSCAFPAPPRC